MTSCCSCCIVGEPIGVDDVAEIAAGFKALSDPVRVRLLNLIAGCDEECCACDLTDQVDRSQPTVSHHLSILVEAGLLHREQRGKWAWFSVNRDRLRQLSETLAVE